MQEAIAFLYGDHGDDWIDAASTALVETAFTAPVRAAEAEAARFAAGGGRAVVLRFGMFYAPGAHHTETMVGAARRGFAAGAGDGDGWFPQIHADDAAAAVLAALDAPGGTYDVVDDEPLRRRDQDAALAAAVGRKGLRRPPAGMTRKVAGPLADSQRVTNSALREATAWQPAYPSVRVGWPAVIRDMHVEPALGGLTRLLLWVMGIGALAVGVQAQFFPRTFYNDFPFGRGWVAMDGPFNEHLIRDVGGLNLAIAVLTFAALWVSTRTMARVAAIATLVYTLPHWIYHLAHLDHMPTADKWGIALSLAPTVLAPIAVLFLVARPPRPRAAAATPAPERAPANTG